jgi:hypothetical protein
MRCTRILFSALLALTLLTVPAPAASAKPIETFRAFAASLGTGRAGSLTITINRWSTDAEREMLLTTLQEFGPDKLVDTLMKLPPVGYMRTPNSLGYDLYYARNNPAPDGGRQVVIGTNRRVRFREAATSQRSLQYQMTVIELRLNADGKGEGKMVPAAKVSWNAKEKKIAIENYNALPVDLLNVQSEKP